MLTLINARVPNYRDLQQIDIDRRGIIDRIESMNAPVIGEKTLDIAGDWLSLGGVDLQINGGLGLAFPDLEETDLDRLDAISDYLWSRGVDGYLPTLVTTSIEKFRKALSVIDRFLDRQKQQNKNTARVLGVHLEGPFLNPQKRGAHPAEYILYPSVEAIEDIFEEYLPLIKIVTLAPELDMNGEVVRYLSDRGIIVSLGHSEASDIQAKKAFENGARMVTHAFNAMPSLHHRKPGLLTEAILHPRVYCGLIADGKHVNPNMIQLLLRASDYEKGIFLVSDALAPIGLEDGLYPWDDRQIQVVHGTAKLLNGTLAGTTLPLLQGVVNLVKWDVCDVPRAILLATEAPRKAIGIPGLSVGQPATLLRWNDDDGLRWERIDLADHLGF
ncbi:N-acetylglucosamine-6-phosphate deacetylase [Pannus brasiliensis CCIBt3594]|uniref:N-acetylglucosamine-6-phosphate deacetylase n=1 Tax=Pannus brasiliensis CCIBt3594 TaxID=1427578 RepID=A0AAW9QUD0_9CHRO